MILIAAVDKNWSIGLRGRLLVQIPADQEVFRDETKGKVLVMGRRTYEGIHGGTPLPDRTTFVLSRDPDFHPKTTLSGKVQAFRTKEDLLKTVADYDKDDVVLAGGAMMYREFLPYCDRAEITYIDYVYDADTMCPNLEKDPEWKLVKESGEHTYFSLVYTFRRYDRLGRKEG